MTQLSKEGLLRLREKIDALKKERADLRSQRAEAYVMGGDGWHDNPVFEHIEAEEKRLSAQIARFEREFETAEIVSCSDVRVTRIGSRATIRFPDGSKKIFQIGDRYTADPSAGIISLQSPLGRALEGLAVDAACSYRVGEKEIRVVVEDIEMAG